MHIANVQLESDLLFAPIAGFSDVAMRHLCSRYGAGLTYTELISAKGIIYNGRENNELLASLDSPCAVQLFGHEPEFMYRAAKDERLQKFDVIDINAGCPVKKIFGNGDGSALMTDTVLLAELVHAAREGSGKPVTVKMRAGIEEGKPLVVQCALAAEKSGAAAEEAKVRASLETSTRTLSKLRGELSDGDLLALIQPEEQAPERKEGEPEELPLSGLPNFRPALLERYTAWAQAHPEAGAEEAVLTVNMDLDRPFYDNPQEVEDPDSLTALVNKYHSLPKGYAPQVETLGSRYGTGALRQEAAQAFRDMADGARADGISLRSVSAYRSYQTQSGLYAGYLKTGKRAVVDTYSARAGHSEHQTGLALDINTASIPAHFENTPAYAWLMEHCAQYGFILRYPQGKDNITGYRFEPWHYRYVGVEAAQACMSQGLCYEEYLALLPG